MKVERILAGAIMACLFATASTYSFACSAHASGQMSIVVAPTPEAGWPRLQWRWQRWKKHWKEESR